MLQKIFLVETKTSGFFAQINGKLALKLKKKSGIFAQIIVKLALKLKKGGFFAQINEYHALNLFLL